MTDPKDISDEILSHAREYIDELLRNKKLNQTVRAQLEIQSYFLMFLVADHEKVSEMYPVYKHYQMRRQRWEVFWEKFQWLIIIPTVTGLLAFFGQFIYFWIVIVPKLALP